ncbi:MAG: VWA domain-containing protein, partial [Rubrivivax sp.]|nr:VWA domain-containing protein [Rubrivivax sp.]
MSFQWPTLLWTLLLLPLLVVMYLWLLRRRRRQTVRLASVAIAKQALGKGPGWRRHVPPLLMLLAMAALLLATARPTAVITLPLSQRTIILAMDVSGSMRAEDVKPNRLAAAQEAAKVFVNDLPREVKVGVVSFAGTAAVVQAPTTSRDDVVAAIDRFQLQRGTATGSGIVLSLATLFPDDGIEIQHITGQRKFPGKPLGEEPPAKPFVPVAPGSYNSAAIIMLTDGQRTTGPDPMEAAKMAAE